MGRLSYVPATVEHLHYVAHHMRQEDVDEIRACSGHTPLQALLRGLDRSDQTVTAVDQDGVPVLVFGIAPGCRLTGLGVPWMLGTDAVNRYRREMILDARRLRDMLLDLYPHLENYVHIKHLSSVRWLKLLGFQMDPPVTMPNGEQFHRFHISKE